MNTSTNTVPKVLESPSKVKILYWESGLDNFDILDLSYLLTAVRSLFAFLAVKNSGKCNKIVAQFLNKHPSSVTCMVNKMKIKVHNDSVLYKYWQKVMQSIKA